MLVDNFDGVVFNVKVGGDSALISGGEIPIGLGESHHLRLNREGTQWKIGPCINGLKLHLLLVCLLANYVQ